MYAVAPEGCCELCLKDLGDAERRSVSTPQGRRPVHASCHQKWLDIDAADNALKIGDRYVLHPVSEQVMEVDGNYTTTEEDEMPGTAVANWDERFAEMAARAAAAEKVSGDFLSVKGGVLAFQDEPLPGNQMLVVILTAVTERTFYAEKYDADAERNSPPICYAFGPTVNDDEGDDEEMGPHPSMQADLDYFSPQNHICKTCPNNVWGTADQGKGKACGERRRMALLPAGYFTAKKGSRDFDMHLIDDPHHYVGADIAYLKLPVTSVKEWAKYVTSLASGHSRPPCAAITRIFLEPHQKHQFHVHFELIELLPPELFETVMARVEEAEKSIIFGYTAPGMEAEEEEAPPRKSARRK